MRESEGKWKEAGAAASLAPKSFINDQVSRLQCNMGLIYWPRYAKLRKYMNWPLLHEGQFRKTPKIVQKGQTSRTGGG